MTIAYLITGGLGDYDTGGGGGGVGANTVTITITDTDDAPLQGATVTAKLNGIVSGTGTTDVSGEVELALDDATYAINVTCFGYNGSVNSLVVNGDETVTYELTSIVITPSTPPTVTGWLIALNAGVPVAGITHNLTMVRVPVGEGGSSFEGSVRVATSSDTGLVQFTGLIPGATYNIKRSSGQPFNFTAGTEDFSIADCIG